MAASPGAFVKGPDSRRFGGGRAPSPRVTLPDGKRRTLAEIARACTLDSINVLHRCVLDEGEDMNVRIRAAGYLLTLGWGAAPKEATLRLESDNRTCAQLSNAELIAHAMEWFEKREKLESIPPPIVVDAGDKAAD